MTWLTHHVPITLIADLADPEGPHSREILTYEAVADDVARDAATLPPNAGSGGAEDGDQEFSGAQAAC
jgi:hypothetical protein